MNLKKIQTFNWSENYFNNHGTQLYLIFQPIYKITTFSGLIDTILVLESKGLSNEKFTCAHIANVFLQNWYRLIFIRLKFIGSCLKQEDKAPYAPKNVVNLFVVYELDMWPQDLNTDFTLKDCLFKAVKLTKHADTDK